MKRSPVQITELFYPVLSYEANPGADPATFDPTMPVDVKSSVAYCSDDEHMVRLTFSQSTVAENFPYSVNLEAYAVFTFDKESAKELYGELIIMNLSVNVVSILFSSAREVLAHATARGPYGAVYIEGVVIDACSVEINFDEDPKKMIPRIFGVKSPDSNATSAGSRKKGVKGSKRVSKE